MALRRHSLFRTRLLVIGAFTFALAGAVVAAPSFQELEESLTCQCGCGLTVHSCNHLQCPSALPLRDEIRDHTSAGEDKETILAAFSAKYGEKILSSPTTEGFNLLAWTTPFVVLGIGGVILAMTLRRWRVRSGRDPVVVAGPPPASGYQEQLERELRDFDS